LLQNLLFSLDLEISRIDFAFVEPVLYKYQLACMNPEKDKKQGEGTLLGERNEN